MYNLLTISRFIPMNFAEWCELIVCITVLYAASLAIYTCAEKKYSLLYAAFISFITCTWLIGSPLVAIVCCGALVSTLLVFTITSVPLLRRDEHTSIKPQASSWIEALTKLSLEAMNESHELLWIIDQHNNTSGKIPVRIHLEMQLTPASIDIILCRPMKKQLLRTCIIRIDGTLIGIDLTSDTLQTASEQLAYVHDLSNTYGVIIVTTSTIKRTFSIIIEKKRYEDLSSHHTTALLNNFLQPTQEYSWPTLQTPTSSTEDTFSGHVLSEQHSGQSLKNRVNK